jgi:hypothetical protein
MYLLGTYFENLHKRYPPEHPFNKKYLDKAIEYYQKSLDNGYDKAANKLRDIYWKK